MESIVKGYDLTYHYARETLSSPKEIYYMYKNTYNILNGKVDDLHVHSTQDTWTGMITSGLNTNEKEEKSSEKNKKQEKYEESKISGQMEIEANNNDVYIGIGINF